MKKLSVLSIIILIALSSFITCVNSDTEYILYDDYWIIEDNWQSSWWSLYEDSNNVAYGGTALNSTIPAHVQYQSMRGDCDFNFTATPYTWFMFMYYTNKTENFRLAFHTDDNNFYYETLDLNTWINQWHYWGYVFSGSMLDVWSQYGSPNKEDINFISIMMLNDNSEPMTLNLDYWVFGTEGIPFPFPPEVTPTPEPTQPPIATNQNFIFVFVILLMIFNAVFCVKRVPILGFITFGFSVFYIALNIQTLGWALAMFSLLVSVANLLSNVLELSRR